MVTKIRSILIPFVTLCIILGVAAAVIAYGRGYRVDLLGKSLKATGLLVVHSDPTGAQILLDGKLRSATPATINLPPGWYTVTVTKEGFQPWSGQVKVQGEIVAKADAFLLPTNPSLAAITASGVANPALSPDGGKLAFIVPMPNSAAASGGLVTTKPGIWVLELIDKPLGLNRDARQVARSEGIDFSKATLSWSPDSKQIVATLPTASKTSLSYLLDADKLNDPPSFVNDIKLLQSEWKEISNQREKEKRMTLPQDIINIATTSMGLVAFSPDETKILYEATASGTIPPIIKPPLIGSNNTSELRDLMASNVYVYDIKEDRNYRLGDTKGLPFASLQWLPTSRHLALVSKDKIEVLDFDGTNRRTAYAGPFWDSFAVPWASGGKLVILTNLNPSASAVNNLYAVNLR